MFMSEAGGVPESVLGQETQKPAWPVPFEYRGVVWSAWSIVSLLALLPASRHMGSPDAVMTAFALLSAALRGATAVLAVYVLHGAQLPSRKSPYGMLPMSLGGLVWRSYLAMLLSLLPMLLVAYLVLGPADVYTMPRLLLGLAIGMVSEVFVVWLLFSKDRVGQLRWCISLLRGY